MQYHYVLTWSESRGWYIDWPSTIAKFDSLNVYVPNIDTWVFPGKDTESKEKEDELLQQLQVLLDQLNK